MTISAGSIPTTGIPQTATTYQPLAAAPVATAPVAYAQANPTTYSAAPVTGGGLGTSIADAVSRLVANASTTAQSLSAQLSTLYSSGESPNPAQLQDLNWKMTQCELQQQQAQKLQEREENMIRAWLRPG